MEKFPLYSIGYGKKNSEEFIKLLKQYDITYLIDIRSKPFSKFNPDFNQNQLMSFLEKNNIKYVFMGDTIGGRPDDLSCYDEEGKVNYEVVKTKTFFKSGIERLKTAYTKNIKAVIMCSESNPCQCHRSKLIGRVLISENIDLKHIDEKGRLKDQVTVISELNKGLAEYDLFGNPTNSKSRKVYI